MSQDERQFTVRLRGVGPEKYADIVNAVWMQMQAIGCDFTVTPDGQSDAAKLDARWDDYSGVSWTEGGRDGTPQAKAARAHRTRNRRSADTGE
ncbi:hypothetical protein [Micromonospora rifamycinica]|uniref:Uncharacterized protein n=1 Tax=Micromonospora rifamycinica TaxID=291594 RepID=A0A109IHT9_9ACTN|nr:hypothetical protein [Micromonospora rifamycinica]KWV30789.1 hypothetical protein AWV63_21105 [Micromonospora rifamycinica]SCG40281.1 hypothetical protein GA0070623_0651 [Micromonospora rifamycinica]